VGPKRLFRLLALGALALLSLYWLLLFVFQRALLFPRAMTGPARARPKDAEQIWLPTIGGRVEAWLLRPKGHQPARSPLILYTHGNGELIDFWPAAFDEPRRAGFAVLLVEYPGYGRSAGSPSEGSIRETVAAAYDFARGQHDLDPDRIIAYGRSLGGGAACLLAGERPVAALVLQSTFTSVRALAPRFLAPGFLVRDPFDNLASLSRYSGPVLVLHGEADEVIPLEQGRALARAGAKAAFLSLRCGHNDCVEPWPQILEFLAAHGLRAAP